MPQRVQTGQTWRLGCLGAERYDPMVSGSACIPLVLRVWLDGSHAVTQLGQGPARACVRRLGSRHDSRNGGPREGARRAACSRDCAARPRVAATSWTASRVLRMSRRCSDFVTLSDNSYTQSNISEFIRT
jgi:hypothetical protein